MGKFNLSEAAKSVLMNEGSKETFDANIAAKRGQREDDGTQAKHKGSVGKDKLSSADAYGTKETDVGHTPTKASDHNPDYTKGTPSATPPGATPPVGSQAANHLDKKFNQQASGRQDLVDAEHSGQHDAESVADLANRKASKLAPQTMKANPGAHFQQYEETEEDGETIAEDRREGILAKVKASMQEDINALMSGENLSEDFVSKATTIFEAAVVSRTEAIVEEIEGELLEQFDSAVEQIKEELSTKVDDYLNYMVEEWIKENEIAIQSGLKAEIVEDFITGLKDLFESHYIDIPTEKVDVVEELTTKVEELENSLNEQIKAAIELNKQLDEAKKNEAIHAVCEGLTQTQVEKMKSLAEGVEFTTEEEFASKMETLKESYFKAEVKVADNSALDDEVLIEETDKKSTAYADSLVEAVAKTISQAKK